MRRRTATDQRLRLILGGGIVGAGMLLLGYQGIQLMAFLLSGPAMPVTSPGFNGMSLAIGLVGFVLGIAIGWFAGQHKSTTQLDAQRQGITIEGRAQHIHDDG